MEDSKGVTSKSNMSKKKKNDRNEKIKKSSKHTLLKKIGKKYTTTKHKAKEKHKLTTGKNMKKNKCNKKARSPSPPEKLPSGNKSIADAEQDDDWKEDKNEDIQLSSNLPNYADKFGIEEDKVDQFKLVLANVNLRHVIIDEICLEGLDGITLEALWTRLDIALKQSLPVNATLKRYTWNMIKDLKYLKFYILEEARPKLIIHDRFQNTDPLLGIPIDPVNEADCFDIYPHCVVTKNGVLGSAADYETRKDISDCIKNLTLEEAELNYGSQLIVVGDTILRSKAIKNCLSDPIYELTLQQYCLLERIGRSRYQGEITCGMLSLQRLCKDPKILFYNRKILENGNLIVKQSFSMRNNRLQSVSVSLVHLQRFYNERKPKFQIMTEQIVDFLRDTPNNLMEYVETKKVFGNPMALRKLMKLQEFLRFIKIEQIKYKNIYSNSITEQSKVKNNDDERLIRILKLINPSVNVSGLWNENEPKNESSDEEEEGATFINHSILHHVYKCIKQNEKNGSTIKEVVAGSGFDYYTVRGAIKQLVNCNLIVATKFDCGRQRTMRYRSGYSDEPKLNVEQTDRKTEEIKKEENWLEKESIQFLSDLLDIDAELLTSPTPSEIEPSREFNMDCDENYILIKNLRKQKKMLNSTDNPSTEKDDLLESIFKNHHEYKILKNSLYTVDELNQVIDSEVCQDICSINVTNKGTKKNWNYNWLLSAIHQQIIKYEKQLPLKNENTLILPILNSSYNRLCNNVFKVVECILQSCEHKIKILMPKSVSENEMSESSQNEYRSQLELPENKDVNSLNILKRKTDFFDNRTPKKTKLDENECATQPHKFFMGPMPTLIFETVDGNDVDIKIFISTKPEEFSKSYAKYTNDNTLSVQALERADFVIETVRRETIVTDMNRIQKMILAYDKEKGYNTKIDRRTLIRIYTRLVVGGYIKILKVTLKSLTITRDIHVLCDSGLELTQFVLESIIEQVKSKFFMQKIVPPKSLPPSSDTSQITDSVDELSVLSNHDSPYVYHRTIGRVYGNLPKFMRLRIVHEFLFYVMYDYPSHKKPIDIQKLLKSCPVEEDVINEMPSVYNQEISWKMFIPPLQKHIGWRRGWALVCDLILRLPLSLFVKIFNVPYVIPELSEYLNHPIRQHYLLRYLPIEIRNGLLHRRKYVFTIHESLVRLCFIGLVQFGPQKLREKDQLFIYLNRKASLLDTTTNKEGYHKIEDKEYNRLHYSFNSMADVEVYWKEMWNICAHSNLGLRISVTGTYITIEQAETKPALKAALLPQTAESALEMDNGHIPGDNRGAAGLDSALWSHLRRNWAWTTSGKLEDMSDPHNDSNSNNTIKNQIEKKSSPCIKKSQHFEKSEKHKSSIETEGIRRGSNDIIVNLESGKTIIRKVESRCDKKAKKLYDTVDRAIMARLRQSRVDWNEKEDKLLQICKIFSKFLQIYNRKRNISYIVVRDVLHILSPKSTQKTSGACQRRMSLIFGSTEQQEMIHRIVKVLHYIPFVKKYFVNFLNSRKLSEKELNSAFVYLVVYFHQNQHEIVHFFEVIANKDLSLLNAFKRNLRMQQITSKSDLNYSTTDSRVISPGIISYECINMPPKSKASVFYYEIKDHPNTEEDVIVDTIRSIIHSSVGCKHDDISWVHQLFRVYKNYPNDLLKIATDHVRSTQMVTLRGSQLRKNYEAESLPIAMKTLQFSFYYCFIQITNFPLELFTEAHEIFLGILKHKTELIDTCYNGLPMECFEQGHAVGLSEISVHIKPHFNIDIPKEALILNPNITDHSELIRELAIRYKKMLTSVKQGIYFKDDENAETMQASDSDSNDSTEECFVQDKTKSANRIPMIQRFLKSWFLTDENDKVDDTMEESVNIATVEISKDSFNFGSIRRARSSGEKRTAKKRRQLHHITTQESKKILESLYSETTERKVQQTANPVLGSVFPDLSFEEYEKKLENLLGKKDTLNLQMNTEKNTIFNENEDSSILKQFLTSRKVTAVVPTTVNRSLENITTTQSTVQNKVTENSEKVSQTVFNAIDPVMNARIQYSLDDDLTIEKIMEEMLAECPPEERKVPKPTNLARLLVKGLFPELDEDDEEERLEKLQQHFLIVCPDTNLSLSDYNNEIIKYLESNHSNICRNLLKNIQTNIIVNDCIPIMDEVFDKFKDMGATQSDVEIVKALLEFIKNKETIGASMKELRMENFQFQMINLSTVLTVLTKSNVLLRAGITYNVFVHHKYRKHWLVESCTLGEQDKQKLKETNRENLSDENSLPALSVLESYTKIKLQIRPWARIDGTLNLKVFEKWMCTILGYCLSGAQVPLIEIFSSCYYLKPVDVYYLLECLQELGCVHLVAYRASNVTLFSSASYVEAAPANITDDFEDIFVELDHLAVVKLGTLINRKSNEFNFPSDESKKHETF